MKKLMIVAALLVLAGIAHAEKLVLVPDEFTGDFAQRNEENTFADTTINGTLDVSNTATFSSNPLIYGGAHSKLSIIGETNGYCYLEFGDSDDNNVGYARYTHSTDTLQLGAGGTWCANFVNGGVTARALDAGTTKITTAEYADNAAAVTAGLAVGTIYRTGDILKIVH